MASTSSEDSGDTRVLGELSFMQKFGYAMGDTWMLVKENAACICKFAFTMAFITGWFYYDPVTHFIDFLTGFLEFELLSWQFLTGFSGMVLSTLCVQIPESYLTRALVAVLIVQRLPINENLWYNVMLDSCHASHLPLTYTQADYESCMQFIGFDRNNTCSIGKQKTCDLYCKGYFIHQNLYREYWMDILGDIITSNESDVSCKIYISLFVSVWKFIEWMTPAPSVLVGACVAMYMIKMVSKEIPEDSNDGFETPEESITGFETPEESIAGSKIPEESIADFKIPEESIADSKIPKESIAGCDAKSGRPREMQVQINMQREESQGLSGNPVSDLHCRPHSSSFFVRLSVLDDMDRLAHEVDSKCAQILKRHDDVMKMVVESRRHGADHS